MTEIYVTAEMQDGTKILENERVVMADKIWVERYLNNQGKKLSEYIMYAQALYAYSVAKRLNKVSHSTFNDFLNDLLDAVATTPEENEESDGLDALE